MASSQSFAKSRWHGYTVCHCPCMNSRAYCPLMLGPVSLSDSCPLWPTKVSSQSTDRLASFPRFPLIDLIDQNRTCVSCCSPPKRLTDTLALTSKHTGAHTDVRSLRSRAIPLDIFSSTCAQVARAQCDCACCVHLCACECM